MARKFLYFIAVCIVLYIGARIALAFYPDQLTRLSFTPDRTFEAQPALKPNAYADPALWLARPGDPGQALVQWKPEGFNPTAEEAGGLNAAVFFVHPTSYLKKAHWNAPLDDPDANRISAITVRGIASVFGAAREVWAPRYRQATFGAFATDAPEAKQAHNLAYADVAEAFDAFVAAQPANRPIILAGHSQGAFILKRLLAEKIAGTPLSRRIAAVYAVGWVVDRKRDLPGMGLPACSAPDQSRCVISFLSFADQADTTMMREAYERFAGHEAAAGQPDYLCSNPLTGGIGGSAPASANAGGIVPDLKFETATLTPGLVGASCAPDGSLRIGTGPDLGPFVLPGGNYHVYDYALYWLPLRQDFARRVAAWQNQR
ncbi:MAG: DUF3089 domain-containing protein [Sphingomonadales bacterium]|nr:DUF3089 domain-containing protein [Sphingomonadales bacterium]